MEFERRCKSLEANIEEISKHHQSEIEKIESNYKKKSQVLDLKITQMSLSNG
jgi:Skp family chaperone for outer membrane proteins